MNTFKLKNLFLSLATVAFMAFLLTSCEKEAVVQEINEQVMTQDLVNAKVVYAHDLQEGTDAEIESRAACGNYVTELTSTRLRWRGATGTTCVLKHYTAFGSLISSTSYNSWACKNSLRNINIPFNACKTEAIVNGNHLGKATMYECAF